MSVGQKVRVTSGPCKGLEGEIVQVLMGGKRIVIRYADAPLGHGEGGSFDPKELEPVLNQENPPA